MSPWRSASQREEEGCPTALCGLSEQNKECWFGERAIRLISFLPFFPLFGQLLLETTRHPFSTVKSLPLSFFLCFYFEPASYSLAPGAGTEFAVLWCWHIPSCLNDPWAGHPLFSIQQTLSQVGKELRLSIAAGNVCICPQLLRPTCTGSYKKGFLF